MNKKKRNKRLLKKDFITKEGHNKLDQELQKELDEKKSAFMERIHLELQNAILK